MSDNKLLMFSMQYGGKVAFAGVKYPNEPNQVPTLFERQPVAKGSSGNKKASPMIKGTDRVKFKHLDVGPAGLLAKTDAELTGMIKKSNEMFARAVSGEVTPTEYFNYALGVSEYREVMSNQLKELAVIRKDMETEHKDNNEIFLVGNNSVYVRDKDGNVIKDPVSIASVGDTSKILRYKDVLSLLDNTDDMLVAQSIHKNYRNVSSNKKRESAVDKASNGLGLDQIDLTVIKNGKGKDMQVVSSLKFNNGKTGTSIDVDLKDLANSLRYKDYTKLSVKGKENNAYKLISDIYRTYDQGVLNNYKVSALEQVLAKKDYDVYGKINNLGDSENSIGYYSSILENLKLVSSRFSKPGDLENTVKSLIKNDGFKTFYKKLKGLNGNILDSVVRAELKEELEKNVSDDNIGYDFTHKLTDDEKAEMQYSHVLSQANADMMDDVFRRLDITGSVRGKSDNKKTSGGGSPSKLDVYTPMLYLKDTTDVATYLINDWVSSEYSIKGGGRAKLTDKSSNLIVKGNPIAFGDDKDPELIYLGQGKRANDLMAGDSYYVNGDKVTNKEDNIVNGKMWQVTVPFDDDANKGISEKASKPLKFMTLKNRIGQLIDANAKIIASDVSNVNVNGTYGIYKQVYPNGKFKQDTNRITSFIAEYILVKEYGITTGHHFKLNDAGKVVAKSNSSEDELLLAKKAEQKNLFTPSQIHDRVKSIIKDDLGVLIDASSMKKLINTNSDKIKKDGIKSIIDTKFKTKHMLAQESVSIIDLDSLDELGKYKLNDLKVFGNRIGGIGQLSDNDMINFFGSGEAAIKRKKYLADKAVLLFESIAKDQAKFNKYKKILKNKNNKTLVDYQLALALSGYWELTRGLSLIEDKNNVNDIKNTVANLISEGELSINDFMSKSVKHILSKHMLYSNINPSHEQFSEYSKNEKFNSEKKHTDAVAKYVDDRVTINTPEVSVFSIYN